MFAHRLHHFGVSHWSSHLSRRDLRREQLGLLHDQRYRRLLLVRRVPVLRQEPDPAAHQGAHLLALVSVHAGVRPHHAYEFERDPLERLVA